METSPLLILLSAGLYTSAFSSHYEQSLNITNEGSNWTVAQTYCREHHTDLVTLHSQAEVQRLGIDDFTWIGLRRSSTTKWSDGEEVTYTNSSEDTRELYCNAMNASGQWCKLDCSSEIASMCYTKGDSSRSLKYILQQDKLSWCEAQRHCREHHTDLVSITTENQNDQVLNKWKTGGSSEPFWIGLMHADWEWSDGACSTFRTVQTQGNGQNCTYIYNKTMKALECDQYAKAMCYKEEIHLIQMNKTWERALYYCNNHHEAFLRIESRHDQLVLEAELMRVLEAGLKNGTAPAHVWLGLRQSRLFGFWFWPNGLSVGWSNWEGRSQPEQPLSHICGAIATSGPGKFKWSDQNCLSESYFLCEGKER